MGLELGIVGLPNIGKSTLFQAITNKKAEIANYPFCTIEPNIALASVPDTRLDKLCQSFQPQKIIPNYLRLVDIAGLVKGASKGEGLGNQFLQHIQKVDAYIHLVRCFQDENITHVSGECSPAEDIATIKTELLLSDIERLENRLAKLKKQTKADKNKDILIFCENLLSNLNKGSFAKDFPLANKEQEDWLKEWNLITAKPFFFVLNHTGKQTEENLKNIVEDIAKEHQVEAVPINCLLESELSSFTEADKKIYLEEFKIAESGLDQIIRVGFKLLAQISFFTAGKKEVRGWNIKKGSSIRFAAGKIHTDMYKGFIRAEVYSFEDFLEFNSEAELQSKGKIRLEGKNYLVQDGDIVHIRFQV